MQSCLEIPNQQQLQIKQQINNTIAKETHWSNSFPNGSNALRIFLNYSRL